MTTLSYGSTVVELTDDLLRTDEHGWSPVRQSVTPSITGALIVDVSVMSAGEPITLAGGTDSGGLIYGAIKRDAYAQLREMADIPGRIYLLSYRGISYQVVFRHEDPPALGAVDLVDRADPDDNDWVIPTLKFTRVS